MSIDSNHYASFLLDRTRIACRREGYSGRTEERYLYWVRRFLNECEVSVPSDIQPGSARAFLDTLREYEGPTQKQARTALHFFFDEVLLGPTGSEIVPTEVEQSRRDSLALTGASFGDHSEIKPR